MNAVPNVCSPRKSAALPVRKPNRLDGYDYSAVGAYFVTVCAQDMRCMLSAAETDGTPETARIVLTAIGEAVQQTLLQINAHYRQIRLDHRLSKKGSDRLRRYVLT